MTEEEIEAIILGHNKRNPELLRALSSKRVALNEARSIDHHLWANSQNEAVMLAKALYDSGYLILAISPVATRMAVPCGRLMPELSNRQILRLVSNLVKN
jgi:hypothetical protein